MIYRVLMDGHEILDYRFKRYTLMDPVLNLEVNTAGSFTFTMPPGHENYSDIKPLLSNIEIYEDNDLIWFGRPIEIKVDLWKQKVVYCEGALAFLNDTVQRPMEYSSIRVHSFLSLVIANHNRQVNADRQFTVGNVTVADKSVYRELKYENTFAILKAQCLDAEGGYMFARREGGINYLDWYAEMPYTTNQPVELGLNLMDLSTGFNGSDLATCVLPLGASDEDGNPVTVTSVNGGSDVVVSDAAATYGKITKVVNFSGVESPSELLSEARKYLSDTQFNNLEIECSAAELHFQNESYDQFKVGQTVRCHSAPHLLDRSFPISKMTMRLDTAAKQITLGTIKRKQLTKIVPSRQNVEEALEAFAGTLPDAVMETLEAEVPDLLDLDEIMKELPEAEDVFKDLARERLGLDENGDPVEGWQPEKHDYGYEDPLSHAQAETPGFGDGLADVGTFAASYPSAWTALQDLASQMAANPVGSELLMQAINKGTFALKPEEQEGWIHQVDGVTQPTGTINFIT